MGSSTSRDDRGRRRKRVPPPPAPRLEGEDLTAPPGMMWPDGGFEADQFSPAGEVLAFSRLFQALKRRWRRR